MELDPPQRIAFRFSVAQFSTEQTLVTVDIAPEDGGCTLTLTHDGVWSEYAERTMQGWNMILDSLARTLG